MAQPSELQIMGGNIEGEGNASILREFNFHSDPEAALIVLSEYSCNIILIPWEVPKRTELKVENRPKIPSITIEKHKKK